MNWDKIHVHTFSLFLLGVAVTSLSLAPIYIKPLLPLCRYLSTMRLHLDSICSNSSCCRKSFKCGRSHEGIRKMADLYRPKRSLLPYAEASENI